MNNTAVVILGHGSRRSEGQVTVTQTADRYRQDHPEYRTAYAFMEFVEPTLPQITAELYEDGIRVFYVVPLFLSMGTHCAKHMPEMIATLRQGYPDAEFLLAPPLGADPLLCTIVEKRVQSLASDRSERGDERHDSDATL